MREALPWGSSLTSGEFAAIRSVGFEPVGQVFGAAVFGIARGDGYSCPRTPASSPGLGPLGPLVEAMDQARRTAAERMTAQCAELGGDGVVGVRVTRGAFVLGGQEFTALGTAVRANGVDRGGAFSRAKPFSCDLSGADFAKLILAGWVPAGLVLGVAIGACHDDWQTTRQTRRWSGNREVAGWTEVVNQARRDAGHRLEEDARRLGADGAVVADVRLRVSVRDCPAQPGRRDHVVEASVIGTAVASFEHAARDEHGHGNRSNQENHDNQDDAASMALAVLPLIPPGRPHRMAGPAWR